MCAYIRHSIHVLVLISLIICLQVLNVSNQRNSPDAILDKPETNYDIAIRYLLYAIQLTTLLALPSMLFHFLGLISFNAFPGEIKIKKEPNQRIKDLRLPFVCFRIVTRGTYPELVQRNVNKNYQTCVEVGLSDFSLEVITDNDINLLLPDPGKVRQVVVPKNYETKTKAKFKGRALQYALESQVNNLKEGDYIVHLDEETIMTRNSVHGIINFMKDGTHSFGQGYITYASQGVVNWFTTLADSIRVAEDFGRLRFQLKVFHKPIFSWKGSYVVTKYKAEADVSWDNGPDSSVTEDCYFAIKAFALGYTFDFIEGEMWEKSPFTISDMIRQRKRWIQGMLLVVHCDKLPVKYKFFLAITLYAWLSLPLSTLGIAISIIHPVSSPLWISIIGTYCFSMVIYMYIFGVLKSFYLEHTRIYMISLYLVIALLTIVCNIVIENIAVIWGLIGEKHQFYIVQKETNPKVNLDV